MVDQLLLDGFTPAPARGPKVYDAAWRRLVEFVLMRDGHECQVKLPVCTGHATTGDHIKPYAEGGARLDPANVRAACSACNSSRGGELGNRRKALGRTSRSW